MGLLMKGPEGGKTREAHVEDMKDIRAVTIRRSQRDGDIHILHYFSTGYYGQR